MWVADDNGQHNNQLLENLADLNISKGSKTKLSIEPR